VIGPSGGGKSTFLRCLNLLEVPTSGRILVDGINICDKKADINRHRQKMGMVFQQFNLFNNMNVLDNCVLAQMKVLKKERKEAEKEAKKAAKKRY
jgi:polar amino acid transport system ATP-binding protein